jgi:hypothetical protein
MAAMCWLTEVLSQRQGSNDPPHLWGFASPRSGLVSALIGLFGGTRMTASALFEFWKKVWLALPPRAVDHLPTFPLVLTCEPHERDRRCLRMRAFAQPVQELARGRHSSTCDANPDRRPLDRVRVRPLH